MRRRGQSGSAARAWLIEDTCAFLENYGPLMDAGTRARCSGRIERLRAGADVSDLPGWLLAGVVAGVEHDGTYVLTGKGEVFEVRPDG